MKDKNSKKIENISISNIETINIIKKKIIYFNELIQKTNIHVHRCKTLDILGVSEVNNCLECLSDIQIKLKEISNGNLNNVEYNINKLQIINNEFSTILKNYGTSQIDDLLIICFGNNKLNLILENDIYKFDLIQKYFHPICYKVINIKENINNKIIIHNNNNIEVIKNLLCSDVIDHYKQFHMKVFGLKIYLLNSLSNKCILVYGYLDEIGIDFIDNYFLKVKEKEILNNIPDQENYKGESFSKFISSLQLKDYFINEFNDLYNKYSGYLSNINIIKQKPLIQIVKDFMTSDTYYKRIILIQLLILGHIPDNLYLCYLLYDILSIDNNEKIDTTEQIILFDSFPWKIKNFFKNAMSQTIQYTNDIMNFDSNKIALEQQICLMNVPDSVKEKAIIKLKEIKGKSEDSGSKARSYLEGLLKIPFNIYKREPILLLMDTIKNDFKSFILKYKDDDLLKQIEEKSYYTSLEISFYLNKFKNNISNINDKLDVNFQNILKYKTKNELVEIIKKINIFIKNKNISLNEKIKKINFSSKTNKVLIEDIIFFLKIFPSYSKNIFSKDNEIIENFKNEDFTLINEIEKIKNSFKLIKEFMDNINQTLNTAVYGHDNAKKQIEIIIGQWINGEQDGYCFGFEGPPGVGKTSLAKRGLSKCLKDSFGIERPFSMIQMGGDCNGSTLHGHNYTYIGSTWGSIVQILIDNKCMNPIIFIDEVDKISKTEHGKEIIGILTHLLDSSQNDCFNDKYFNGINLDLSKALFILSYNDVEAIDKVLLDRIHRIKFDNLSLDDKLIISRKHILPDIFKKMGLENIIEMEDNVINYIIENYTSEAGVRKLKELLFQIIGEINIDILKNKNNFNQIPIFISIDDIKNKYFKDKKEISYTQIEDENKIGIINALWANSLGQGGTLPIQASFVPSEKFLHLTLTGSQGEVMKETMNVALTVAWNLTSKDLQNKLMIQYNNIKTNNIFGIHLHTPDCSTPKDGPSATAAITVTIFSLFNQIKIKNNFGITGELNFSGRITEIGGLEYKFLGSIKCGIKKFIYPKANQSDYEKFMEKYKNNKLIEGIIFYPVSTIKEVFDLILESN